VIPDRSEYREETGSVSIDRLLLSCGCACCPAHGNFAGGFTLLEEQENKNAVIESTISAAGILIRVTIGTHVRYKWIRYSFAARVTYRQVLTRRSHSVTAHWLICVFLLMVYLATLSIYLAAQRQIMIIIIIRKTAFLSNTLFREVQLTDSGFHFLVLRNSKVFTEQARWPCVQSPTWIPISSSDRVAQLFTQARPCLSSGC
jgi:hypothetical protein